MITKVPYCPELVSRLRLKAFQLAGINPKEALAYNKDAAYEEDYRINFSNSRSLTFRKAWRQQFLSES